MKFFVIVLLLISDVLVAQNAPQAHFVATNNAICDSIYTEAFTDQSTNNPTTWKWYFAGATPDTSTLKNPSNIVYEGYGCYTVKLVVKNNYGSDSLTDSNMICLDAPPHLMLTGDLSTCLESPKPIDTIWAHGGTSYYWMNGDTNSYIVFKANSIYQFQITVYNNACYKDSTFYMHYDTMPTFVFRGDTSICAGNSTTIYVHNPHAYEYEYLWSTGSTTDSMVVKGMKAGTYTYSLTVTKGGCKDSSQIRVGVHDCTGIENYQDHTGSIQVYPNPSNGEFILQWSVVSGQLSVEIYNMLGEKVYFQSNIQNSTFNINLSNQPNGIYLYRVTDESGNLIGNGKFIIQK